MSGWPYQREQPSVVVKSTSHGLGLGGAAFLVLLVLKLLGKITWSWWWVTAPLWGWLAVVLGLLAVAGVGLLLYLGVEAALDKMRGKP